MPTYRFYNIRKDGHIAGPPFDYEAARDAEALAKAKEALNDLDIEFWEAERIVAYVVSEKQR